MFRNHIIFFHNHDIDRRRNKLGHWEDYLIPIENERLEQQQRRVFLKTASKRHRQIVYNELQQKAKQVQFQTSEGREGSECDKVSSQVVQAEQPQATAAQSRTYRQSTETQRWREEQQEQEQNKKIKYTPAGAEEEDDSSSEGDSVSMESEHWSDWEQYQIENSNWFSELSELGEVGRSTDAANAPHVISDVEPKLSAVAKEGGGPVEIVTRQAVQLSDVNTVRKQADLINTNDSDQAADDHQIKKGAENNIMNDDITSRQHDGNKKTTQDQATNCSINTQQTESIDPEDAAIVHLIAEAMTFKSESVSDLTERIILSNNVFERNETKRLLKAIAMTSRVIVNQFTGTLATAASVDPSGRLGQAMLMQEFSVLRNRDIN